MYVKPLQREQCDLKPELVSEPDTHPPTHSLTGRETLSVPSNPLDHVGGCHCVSTLSRTFALMTASALARYPEQTPNTSETQWKPTMTGEEYHEGCISVTPCSHSQSHSHSHVPMHHKFFPVLSVIATPHLCFPKSNEAL